ncbi:hypothetical protein QJS04_geneDACA020197 [Acorus gramineus]|uniref:Uncharacterized protein n=1 Tax=Acorus gramineus TaxID=55184 RepID=A0AAV9BQ49_ACOGR|nr:hypothetical protein QJS04_geneDACA020197 [Acorus gramineus]
MRSGGEKEEAGQIMMDHGMEGEAVDGIGSRVQPLNRSSTYSTAHPCHWLELVVRAFLSCLGLDPHVQQHSPSMEDEKKTNEDRVLTEMLRNRRPNIKPPSRGSDPQTNRLEL